MLFSDYKYHLSRGLSAVRPLCVFSGLGMMGCTGVSTGRGRYQEVRGLALASPSLFLRLLLPRWNG